MHEFLDKIINEFEFYIFYNPQLRKHELKTSFGLVKIWIIKDDELNIHKSKFEEVYYIEIPEDQELGFHQWLRLINA